jgi:putative peptidoglycan lipid II flippase
VGAAVVVYFGIAFAVGAIDRQRIATLTRKQAPPATE